MKQLLRKSAIFLIAVIMVVAGIDNGKVYAGTDVESSAYGFSIDNDYYKKTCWYNVVTSNVKYNGNIIGTNTTYIGMTRSKSSVSGGYYLDQVMVKCVMKGKNPKSSYCGYAEHLTVESKFPSGMYLVAYSPESEAGMRTYQIGATAKSDKTIAISASTSVTKNALEINNYCDTSARKFMICYDYIHHTFRWNWDTYAKYAYNESIQRAHYTIKTKKSKYAMKLVVTSKFERWSDKPSFWANGYGRYGELEQTITFTTPY